MAYLVGLIDDCICLLVWFPKTSEVNLRLSGQNCARTRLGRFGPARGFTACCQLFRYLSLLGPELISWTDGKNLRELGIYRQTGCYIERIRRNGILAHPDGDAIFARRRRDRIGWFSPDSHAPGPSFRNGKEVFDRNLLDLRIVEEEIVVKRVTVSQVNAYQT